MFIKKHSIQSLVDSISLPEHLKRFIELKRSGSNWLGICPFHQDSNPSFYVYPQNYHCFSCQAHGNVLDYELHRTGLPFKDCLEELAQSYHFSLEYETSAYDSKALSRKKTQADRIFLLNKLKKFFVSQTDFSFSESEIKLLNNLYFYESASTKNSLSLSLLLEQLKNNTLIFELERENKELFGFFFLPFDGREEVSKIQSASILRKINQIKEKEYMYFALSQSDLPFLNWEEARPFAFKEKYIIIAQDILDFKFLLTSGSQNIVYCPVGIDYNLFQTFSRRVKKFVYVIPTTEAGLPDFSFAFLWGCFQLFILFPEISMDVILVPSDAKAKSKFYSNIDQDKIKKWINSASKIYYTITDYFLSKDVHNKSKLDIFKEKLLIHLNKIKEKAILDGVLLDLKAKYFSFDVDLNESQIREIILTNSKNTIENKYQDESNKKNSEIPHSEVKKQSEIQEKEIDLDENQAELFDLMERSAKYYHNVYLSMYKSNNTELSYLHERGLTSEICTNWKIGICTSQNDLANKAQSGLVSLKDLLKLGLIKQKKYGSEYYDFFHDRMIIPIEDHHGKVVALSGRILPNYQGVADSKAPKYINSPETEIFSKSRILFNFHKALSSIALQQCVIVVEGYMDCISLVNRGVKNVVAVMGTALTSYHLNELAKVTKKIILLFDNDDAGKKATKRSFISAVNFLNLNIDFVEIHDCKDPDEYISKYGKEAFLLLVKENKIPLFEKIIYWCQESSQDYQDFVTSIQEDFLALKDSENILLKNQVQLFLAEKFNIDLSSYFNRVSSLQHKVKEQPRNAEPLEISWPIRNPTEIKILVSLVFLKFDELPKVIQNLIDNVVSENENEERICAQAIEGEFSKIGFEVFLEISSWMSENRHISISYIGSEIIDCFSKSTQAFLGFVLSDVKVLMNFGLQELIKDDQSESISMVTYENIWNIRNSGFLKFQLKNITLAHQNKVLPNLFAEALLNLEVDYIDSTLKACTSLHFDNDLDAQIQYLVSERIRCKAQLGNLGLK